MQIFLAIIYILAVVKFSSRSLAFLSRPQVSSWKAQRRSDFANFARNFYFHAKIISPHLFRTNVRTEHEKLNDVLKLALHDTDRNRNRHIPTIICNYFINDRALLESDRSTNSLIGEDGGLLSGVRSKRR